ncbi:MAG: alpha/beta hydrolase [Betaproteobacteria bacterium]|nr:alpha/beta hydrolase [Betaproteobacteria bacterium]PWB63194.1 MAG: alpha/beta hydrolase [Betaproteobacteria bacterium]
MTGRRILSRLAAAVVLVAAVAGCAYLNEKQGELIFRPTQDTWWGYQNAGLAYEERWIPVGGNGDRLHAYWAPADDKSAPVLLYLHGARWNLTGSVTRIERWRKMGFTVLAIDYRGFGKSTQASPSEQLAYEDADAAWDYLAKAEPARARYIVGHSLGGAIATELATRRADASGLVLEATFTSIRDMVEHTAWRYVPVGLILTQEFDTLSKVPRLRLPTLIVHGTRDSVVPYEMGERLYAAAAGPKRFIRVEGGSHHNLSAVAADQYRAALRELFHHGARTLEATGPS